MVPSKLLFRLSLLWLASAVACTPARRCPPKRPERAARETLPPSPIRQRVVDLTQVLQPGMVVWPGGVPFQMTRLVDYDQGYRLHKFQMGENTGTHVDAPSHFVPAGRSIDRIGSDELVLPAVVIDLRAKVEREPDYAVAAADVLDWEAVHGRVPVGCLVLANTGWYHRFAKPVEYLNQDAQGVMHFPGWGVEAARLLAVERDVAGLGIDTLSIDRGASTDFAAHRVLLGADKIGVENLTNLEALPELGATVVLGVLPVADGSEAQARVLALVRDEPPPAFEPPER